MSIRYNKKTAKKRWVVQEMKKYRKFCGWKTLKKLIHTVDFGLRGPSNEKLVHNDEEKMEAKCMIATVFETGARICEVIGISGQKEMGGLKTSDFVVEHDRVSIAFNIEKRYRKRARTTKFKATDDSYMRWKTEKEAKNSFHPYTSYEGYLTKRLIEMRNIVIPRREVLVPLMVDWVKYVMDRDNGEDRLFDIKYNRAYRIVSSAGKKIGEDFPPHRLRAERATQLSLEYGLNDFELTEWFMWKDPITAHDYTTLVPKMIEKMFKEDPWSPKMKS